MRVSLDYSLLVDAQMLPVDGILDMFEQHFGTSPVPLSEGSRESVDGNGWTTYQDSLSKLGSLFISVPEGSERVKINAKISVRVLHAS